ncbi:MAG: hypothetical protein ACP5HU_03300 [Phycisphaerae bacterium]
MLGRLKRTTRLDVGLAISFAGVAYLIWALVAGVTRTLVGDMVRAFAGTQTGLGGSPQAVKTLFVDAGFAIDVVGLAWLAVTLVLIVLASRQRIGISWSWVSAACQSLLAALGGLWVAWAVHIPYADAVGPPEGAVDQTPWAQLSRISLPVVIPLAIVLWATALVWLLVERARYNRRRITLRDGLRTNA